MTWVGPLRKHPLVDLRSFTHDLVCNANFRCAPIASPIEIIDEVQRLGESDFESPDPSASLTNLALTRAAQPDPASAEPLLRRALDIRKKELSPGHPSIIATEVRLGEVLVDEGKVAEAEPLLREAVASIHAVPFPLVPWQVTEAEIALGDCLAFRGRATEAAPLLRDADARLKGYPQATLRREILARAARAQTASKVAASLSK